MLTLLKRLFTPHCLLQERDRQADSLRESREKLDVASETLEKKASALLRVTPIVPPLRNGRLHISPL